MKRTGEEAFKTVFEFHLLESGYASVARESFDRGRAMLPETALAFIRETRSREWAKSAALPGRRTYDPALADR